MLNTVRYVGYRCRTFQVHWVNAPATATRTAYDGPSSSSVISFAAHDTDNVAPLVSGIGSVIFHEAVTHTAARANASRSGSGSARGNVTKMTAAPAAITSAT